MPRDHIAGMELPLADSGFVFLWTTQEHLPDAFRVLERWGLEVQVHHGLGKGARCPTYRLLSARR